MIESWKGIRSIFSNDSSARVCCFDGSANWNLIRSAIKTGDLVSDVNNDFEEVCDLRMLPDVPLQ
jgi:hypothetical protein